MRQRYPEEELHKIERGWFNGCQQIINMRKVTESGIKSAKEEFTAIYHDSIVETLTPQMAKYWSDEARTEVAGMIAVTALANAQLTVDAACLVFAHSMLEAAVMGYLMTTHLFLPEEWEGFVKDNEVTLTVSQLRGIRVEELIERETQIALKKCGSASLPKKVAKLELICRSALPVQIEGFRYDPERLKRLDTERHEIVHGRDLNLKPRQESFDDDLRFMFRVASYCAAMVGKRLGVRVNGRYYTM